MYSGYLIHPMIPFGFLEVMITYDRLTVWSKDEQKIETSGVLGLYK